ncbi:MAG: MerR family DNA-binding transcriptional regulator [Hyphomicrobiaceae bacterium]
MSRPSNKDAEPQSRPEPGFEVGGEEVALTIGDLAAEFAITTRTIRFYEARGLLSPLRRGTNRSYSRRDRARLRLILRGKNLGFTLEDISDYLSLYDSDPTQVTQTKLLLARVEAHIADLNRKRADLDRTLEDLKDIRAQCRRHLGRK